MSNCSGTKTNYACDSELGTSGVCYAYTICTGCKSGYTKTTQSKNIDGCGNITTNRCYDPNCYAGTYKNSSGACISCSVGTYSNSTNASSCTTCPSLSGAYGDSARSKAVNVANGYVTTAGTGSTSINDCYIKNASYYYDTSGTFSFGGTCAYDGTVVVDKCPASSISGACLSSGGTTGVVIDGEKTNDMTGAHCWCNMNGKTRYYGAVGNGTAAACANICTASAACYGLTQASTRTEFGCD
ncbi:MAG: hypothetical protein IKA08_00200 [Alphaproteobacteria bacterium]|nr:hypothetical protein [Alphaproteobacteria bacterium]